MSKRYNLARMSTATTGAGTITLGSAVTSYLSFADAGVSDGETVTYAIEDGNNREIGRGVYTASGTTLTRTVLKSTNSDAAINLSGTAEVFITFAAEDISTLSLSDGSASTPSLTNEGDENTGLWFPAADSIALGTGGSEAVRIDSSQNVGIGITSPTVALDVAGAINTTGNVTVGAALSTVGNATIGGSLDVTDAATTRTNLGLAIGTDVMAYDAELQAIAALTPTDGGFVVGNGSTFVVETGATARTSLGLTIGTDVQAYTSNLAAIENALDFEATDPIITWATGDSLSFDTSENHLDITIGGSVVGRFSAQGLEVGGAYQILENQPLAGTSYDVTIPDWCDEILLVCYSVSTNADAGDPCLLLGDQGGIESTGYDVKYVDWASDAVATSSTNIPLQLSGFTASNTLFGVLRLYNFLGRTTWICDGIFAETGAANGSRLVAFKQLTEALTTVRFTTTNGTATFDAGVITVYVR